MTQSSDAGRDSLLGPTGLDVDDEFEPRETITDEELAEMAVAAGAEGAEGQVAADAVPIDVYLGRETAGHLPDWYMAPLRVHRIGKFGRVVILAFVGALLVIEAFGLCSTYGQLPLP